MSDWVFTEYMIATNIFWLQHWIYVSLYTRVSLLIPLTFCVQTNEVMKKRECYNKVLIVIDLFAYACLCFTITYELINDVDYWFMSLMWSVMCVVLTSALCLSLRRIRRYARGLANKDSRASQGLIYSHQWTFIFATFINLVCFTIYTV